MPIKEHCFNDAFWSCYFLTHTMISTIKKIRPWDSIFQITIPRVTSACFSSCVFVLESPCTCVFVMPCAFVRSIDLLFLCSITKSYHAFWCWNCFPICSGFQVWNILCLTPWFHPCFGYPLMKAIKWIYCININRAHKLYRVWMGQESLAINFYSIISFKLRSKGLDL